MNVLVVGAFGNIGTTITSLLLEFAKDLDIEQVYAHKKRLEPWRLSTVPFLTNRRVTLCSENAAEGFIALDKVVDEIRYVFECGPSGVGLGNQQKYDKFPNLIAASAQGSEKGFGKPFVSGVNDSQITGERFVQVVSCNTHGTAAVLKAFGGDELENLVEADVVVVRRSEDIGSHERLVVAGVVINHRFLPVGTHHGLDVVDLFQTIDVHVDLTTSDINTPSQLMHAMRFSLSLKEMPGLETLASGVSRCEFVSTTSKFDSNAIFELGRRYGYQGRIY